MAPRLIAIGFLWLTASAQAQLLDLDARTAPDAGTGKLALRTADDLEAALGDAGHPEGARATVKAALRRLVVALLRSGEEMSGDGSYRIVVARTMLRRIDDIDTRIDEEFDDIGADALLRIADTLGIIADDDGISDDELDRSLRDALAPLVLHDDPASGVGWWGDETDAEAWRLGSWTETGVINESTAQLLRNFADTLEAAEEQPGYARSAAALRKEIFDACESASAVPDWVAPEDWDTLFDAIDHAVLDVVSSRGRSELRAMLRETPRLVGVLNRLEDADARAAATDMIERFADGDAQAGDASMRVLELFDRLPMPTDGDVQQLRPATRGLIRPARVAREQLRAQLVVAIGDASAASDPAFVGSLSSASDLADDLASIERLTRELTPRNDERDAWREDVAAGLLPLARMVGEEATRERSLHELSLLDEQMRARDRVRAFADELDNNGSTVADHLCDQRRPAFAAMLRRACDTWDRSLADRRAPTPAPEHSRRLGTLDRHTRLMRAFLGVRAITGLSEHSAAPDYPLQRWAGWELSADALRRLAETVEERLIQATAELLDGDDELHGRLLDLVERDAGLAIVVARLNADAERFTGGVAPDPVLEIASGAPRPGAWLAEHRDEIAALCRYAEEWSEAVRIEDIERASRLGRYVRTQAAKVNDALDRLED